MMDEGMIERLVELEEALTPRPPLPSRGLAGEGGEEGGGAGEGSGEGGSRAIEVLRPGRFTDRLGRAVEVTEEDLEAYAAQFAAGAAGQDVPVDVDHERRQAAGWVREVFVEGGRLLARVSWTGLGRQLVGDRVYRYVSASIDTAGKVIKSISLVNFPAVKGLTPVELNALTPPAEDGRLPSPIGMGEGGEQDQENERIGTMEDQERAELAEEIRREERERLAAELADRRQWEADLREQVRAEERERLEAELAERREVVEFAEGVCSGEMALGERPEVVAEVLMRVPREVRGDVERLLSAPRVPMGEIGSGREGRGELAEVPGEYRAALSEWVGRGQKAAEFFEIVAPELGQAERYDLSEWGG